jgi:hypothetical protein
MNKGKRRAEAARPGSLRSA